MELELDREELISQARRDLAALIAPGVAGLPLLALLNTMLGTSSTAGTGGQAVAKNAKSLLNISASETLARLRSKVAKEVGLPVATATEGMKLANQIRLMVALAEADKRSYAPLDRAAGILSKAVEDINELIEPTSVVAIKGACPSCEAETVAISGADWDPYITTALAMKGAKAACRAADCGAVWEGVPAMRELDAKIEGSTVVSLDAARKRLDELNQIADDAQALRQAA